MLKPTRRVLVLFFAVAVCLSARSAGASPIELSAVQWTAQTAGLTTVTETFGSYSLGAHASPFTLLNGTYTAEAPTILPVVPFCSAADACLFDQVSPDTPRTFSTFPSGTTIWAASDLWFLEPNDNIQVTVIGGSGTSVFTHPLSSFTAYSDPTGLLSVSFLNLGSPLPGGGTEISNYSFDDVSTSASSAVPEPASLFLVGGSVIALARRFRRGKS